jgi:hypothetical protein
MKVMLLVAASVAVVVVVAPSLILVGKCRRDQNCRCNDCRADLVHGLPQEKGRSPVGTYSKSVGQVVVPRLSHHTFATDSWPLITGSRVLVGDPMERRHERGG